MKRPSISAKKEVWATKLVLDSHVSIAVISIATEMYILKGLRGLLNKPKVWLRTSGIENYSGETK